MPNKHWFQRLADGIDLNGEPLPGVPVVELAGDHRMLIERHHGIREYSREKIGVNVAFGTLIIQGCGLELSNMTGAQVVISGRIDCIQIVRRCC